MKNLHKSTRAPAPARRKLKQDEAAKILADFARRATIDAPSTEVPDLKSVTVQYLKPSIKEGLVRWFCPLHLGMGLCTVVGAFNMAIDPNAVNNAFAAVMSCAAALMYRFSRPS